MLPQARRALANGLPDWFFDRVAGCRGISVRRSSNLSSDGRVSVPEAPRGCCIGVSYLAKDPRVSVAIFSY
jgi:hypothetical protein